MAKTTGSKFITIQYFYLFLLGKWAFTVYLLLSFPLIQFVAAQKLSDTIAIEEVKVIGTKSLKEAGFSTTEIDSLAFQLLQSQSVSELLNASSPVFIKSYGRGSSATASFRGTSSSHTQLYWNGMKLNSPMRGDVDFSLYPVSFIDQLSLQAGGSSLQSGAGALGGSILINNRADWDQRFNIRYIQTFENFSTFKEYLTVGFGNSRVQFKTRFFDERSENDFSYFNYGVLPMHEAVQKNAAYHQMGFLQEVYLKLGVQLISAKVWVNKGQRKLPQLMSFEGNERIEKQDDASLKAIVDWKYFEKKTKFEWHSGYNNARLNYYRASSEANFVNFDSQSKEQSFTNQIQFDWDPKENISLSWSFNAGYDWVSIFDEAQKTGYNEDQISFSLLNSVHILVLPDWAVSTLIRSEWYDGRMIGFIPGFGTEYYFGEKKLGIVKLNLARNYHQPSLNDRYWLPGGNPDLLPEEGYLGDLNLRYQSKPDQAVSIASQISCFASLIDNWIVWQPAANGATYWEASNLRKVFARGIEVQASSTTKSIGGILINLKGNYSFVATSNQDAVSSVDLSRGKQLIYIPKHKANIFLQADFQKYYLKVNAPFIGKRYTTSNNFESDYEKILNPYWLFNLTCGKTFVGENFKADVSINVENLTNADYMAVLWRPMPGRYYGLTVQLALGK